MHYRHKYELTVARVDLLEEFGLYGTQVNSSPFNLYPSQLVPRWNRIQGNSYPKVNSYPSQLVPSELVTIGELMGKLGLFIYVMKFQTDFLWFILKFQTHKKCSGMFSSNKFFFRNLPWACFLKFCVHQGNFCVHLGDYFRRPQHSW